MATKANGKPKGLLLKVLGLSFLLINIYGTLANDELNENELDLLALRGEGLFAGSNGEGNGDADDPSFNNNFPVDANINDPNLIENIPYNDNNENPSFDNGFPEDTTVNDPNIIDGAPFDEEIIIVDIDDGSTNPENVPNINDPIINFGPNPNQGPNPNPNQDVIDGNPNEGNLTQGNLTQGNLTQGNLTLGNVTEGNATVPNITYGDSQYAQDVYYITEYENPEFEAVYDPRTHPVCTCLSKVYANRTCYNSLPEAINMSNPETVIFIGNSLEITQSIDFWIDLSFYGIPCRGAKPVIYSKVNAAVNTTTGLFYMTNKYHQMLRIRDIDFKALSIGEDVGSAPVIMASHVGHWMSLDIRNSTMDSFLNTRNGSAISLSVSYRVSLDRDTIIQNNRVLAYCDCYGGGAFSAEYVANVGFLNSSASFLNNQVRFPYIYPDKNGSEHGEGGAFYFQYVDGLVHINGTFRNNSGNDGGVLTAKTVDLGSIYMDGLYENNYVVDHGAGSRAGVIRIYNLTGHLEIKGTYINNTATGSRGAVFAGNYLLRNGTIDVDGTFVNNSCLKLGTIISLLGKRYLGVTTIKGTSVFEGNESVENPRENILYIKNIGRLSELEFSAANGADVVFPEPPPEVVEPPLQVSQTPTEVAQSPPGVPV